MGYWWNQYTVYQHKIVIYWKTVFAIEKIINIQLSHTSERWMWCEYEICFFFLVLVSLWTMLNLFEFIWKLSNTIYWMIVLYLIQFCRNERKNKMKIAFIYWLINKLKSTLVCTENQLKFNANIAFFSSNRSKWIEQKKKNQS